MEPMVHRACTGHGSVDDCDENDDDQNDENDENDENGGDGMNVNVNEIVIVSKRVCANVTANVRTSACVNSTVTDNHPCSLYYHRQVVVGPSPVQRLEHQESSNQHWARY